MTPEEILEQQQRHAGAAASEATGNPMYTSAADFDARFTRMLADEEKQEREKQEKKVQRQQAAQAISDTYGVLFNDVIKASQGATVSPRDVQQRYDRLDDKSKQLYDAYRARMDLIRKQAHGNAKGYYDLAQRAKDKGDAEALRAKEKKEDRDWQLEMWERQRKAREAEAAKDRQARYNYYYGKNNKENQYVIDFGNGERKDYKNNTAEGRNAYAAIFRYLLNSGLIPEEALPHDKDGNPITVKTQDVADFYVREFLPIAMNNPIMKSAIYKIVYGVDKDFRTPQEIAMDNYRKTHPQQSQEIPLWVNQSQPEKTGIALIDGAAPTQQDAKTETNNDYTF